MKHFLFYFVLIHSFSLSCCCYAAEADLFLSFPESGKAINTEICFDEIITKNVYCGVPVEIERIKYNCILSKEKMINDTKYYISERCIEVGNNELLSFPSDIVLFDFHLNKINHSEGCFHTDDYSTIVFIGSKEKRTISCTHNRICYESTESLTIPQGKGVFLQPGSLIKNKDGEIIVPHGFFYSDRGDEEIKIVSTYGGMIPVSIVPVIVLPSNYKLNVRKGIISNAILVCDSVEIKSRNKRIFANIVLIGTLKNKALPVEWFGCSVKESSETNTRMLCQYVVPSAIATHTDIFHSSKGTYKINGSYPVGNPFWGFDHAWIKDFHGICIRGRGVSTNICSIAHKPDAPSDVFNIVDSKNLRIKDLSVSCQSLNKPINNGANAFSLIHTIENVEVTNCSVSQLPYVESLYYSDGGKAFTIQCGPNTSQCGVVFRDNYAEYVEYGLDYTKTVNNKGDDLKGIVFEGNTIKHSIVGVVVHEWDSPFGEKVDPIVINGNNIEDCQVGVLCQTTKACTIIRNRIINDRYPKRIVYYDGVYGILTQGAYNTTIQNNQICLKGCDSYINVNVYSYYPQYNGMVKNLCIHENVMEGKYKKSAILVGKENMTNDEIKMLEDILISDNIFVDSK